MQKAKCLSVFLSYLTNWNLLSLWNDGILRMPEKTDCHTSLMAGSQ